MKNEDFDVDEFVDSGIEAAGEKLQTQLDEEGSILNPEDTGSKLVNEQEEQEQEAETQVPAVTTPEVKAEAKAEETETPAQADSTISQLIQNTQRTGVPVESHIKLRQRAQAAEAKVKELEAQQQTTLPAEEQAEVDPFAELDETDLVRVGDVKEFVEKRIKGVVGQVQQTLGQKEAAERAKRFTTQAVASEQAVIKNTPDYVTVTAAALKLGLISEKETVALSKSDNPALEFYKLSKAKLTDIQTTLGITPTSKQSELQTEEGVIPDEDDELPSDEGVLEEIYG